MWKDASYGGAMFRADDAIPGYCYYMPGGFNDAVSSLYNRTGYYLYFYEHGGCVNLMGYALPGAAVGWIGDAANDKMSAYMIQ